MRILHTSDWHLGAQLHDQSRLPEQMAFLAWLKDQIALEKPDVLIIAGDIFDSCAPSNASLNLYYDFLATAYQSKLCQTVVVIGGNPHLATMTNKRYALGWNVKQGENLLPMVIDNYQAEARRPVSNLSGGETFMISLALALGLSGMASGKLQVDSLFLDEGFGTLDSEALDRAISTLSQLHHAQGKLIGVISHIDQLKGQIATKIEVTKVANGRSKLSGPGVERVVPAAAETVPTGSTVSESKPKKGKKKTKSVAAETSPALQEVTAE